MCMSWQFNNTLLVITIYEGGKTWRSYLLINCCASSPHYTAVPERKLDAPLRESMVAGYWLQFVLLLRGMSTRSKTLSQKMRAPLPCITSYPFPFT
jgi:hypothetical protein